MKTKAFVLQQISDYLEELEAGKALNEDSVKTELKFYLDLLDLDEIPEDSFASIYRLNLGYMLT